MKVLFPNPYGRPAASIEQIQAYQKAVGFSDEYAHFLREQNGFSLWDMENSADCQQFLQPSNTASDNRANFRVLNNFRGNDPHYDLEELQAENLFNRHFLEIGSDPAGNPFVEVLLGQHKGKIGSLDHDLFAGAQDWDEFLSNMELQHIQSLSLQAQTDALCDGELGLIWFHALSIQAFVQHCIYSAEDFWGFIVDQENI